MNQNGPGPGTDGWLAERGVLIHVGPPKTGTTALQSSLADARRRLARAGVAYPGKRTSHWHASCAVMGRPGTAHPADPPVPMRRWDRLVTQVARRQARAMVSSEGFADAGAAQIERIVADLGGPDVRVLITVRGLADIVPSSWQQDLKSGAPVPLPGALARLKSRVVKPFDEWVADLIGDRSGRGVFWYRNDFAALAGRWAEVVGPDQVAVVVVRADHPQQILRDAETLLTLPSDSLRLQGRANRSLSREEAELVRAWLLRLERDHVLSGRQYHRVVRRGGLWNLVEERRPGSDETKLVTPGWARDALQQRTDDMVARLRAGGYRVLGDLAALDVPKSEGQDLPPPTWVPDEAAIAMLMGVIRAAADAGTDPGASSSGEQSRSTLRGIVKRVRR